MTPKKAENLFERVGNMEPSKSSFDRLPKATGDRWEGAREANEQVLRDAIVVPEGTQSIAVSLDRVLAPVDGGNSPTEVRNAAAAEGRMSKGPAGYREVGCATKHGVSFEEAATALVDPFALEVPDRVQADRTIAIGTSARLRVLFVVTLVIAAGDVVRIISARKATPFQRKKYEEAP